MTDGWVASLTQWTWIWASSRSWWWTGKPSVLQSMGWQRVGHNLVTETQKQHVSFQSTWELLSALLTWQLWVELHMCSCLKSMSTHVSHYPSSLLYITLSGKPLDKKAGKLGWIKPKIKWCNDSLLSRKIFELEITRIKLYFLIS